MFFDLRADADHGRLAVALQGAEIRSVTCGNGRIIICDSNGLVRLFDRNWAALTFRAYGPNSFMMCELIASCNYLVTVGSDTTVSDSVDAPVLKFWNLNNQLATTDTMSSNESVFQCTRTAVLMNSPVCLSVAENGHNVAVGYPDGHIQLFRGDVRSSRPTDSEKLQCGTATVVGMAFVGVRPLSADPHKDEQQLFVCTTEWVAVFTLSEKDSAVMTVLDRKCDSANRCCVMQRQLYPSSSRSATCTEELFMVGHDKVRFNFAF